jgi:hypothetical protein
MMLPRHRRRSALTVLALCLALALPASALAAPAQAQADEPRLTPPTATRFADPAWYDVVDAAVVEGSDPIRLRVELGAIDPSGGLPLGITQPIVEVYVDTGSGGASELLPGSGMRMPDGDGWNVAVRITGDGAWGWFADEEGEVDLARPVALEATAAGRTVEIQTPFAATSERRLYAITGVYDPFRPDGWRQTTREPSPWAFSSPEWSLPVVDVFPADPATTARAVSEGVLPRRAVQGVDVGVTLWIALMLSGLAVAIVGLWWRRREPAPATAVETPVLPRYTVLENPAWIDTPAGEHEPSIGAPFSAPAGRRGAGAVDGDLLIGEGDFEALLARLDEALGTPLEVVGGATDGVPDPEPSGVPVVSETMRLRALPAPDPAADDASDPFDAFARANDDDDRARDDADAGAGRLHRFP